MANNLRNPVEVSPGVRDTDQDGTPDVNTVSTPFGETKGTDWVSEWFAIDGVEHGAEELSVMCFVDWQGATFIDLLPQLRHDQDAKPADPQGLVREAEALPVAVFDGSRLDTNFEAVQDTVRLLAANFRVDPGSQEVAFAVGGVSQVRFLAQSDGAPVLRMQLLSGGGWRGA
jgi:hypothetical protein